MRLFAFLFSLCISALQIYLSVGSNSTAASPVLEDIKLATFAASPAFLLGACCFFSPSSRARAVAGIALAALAVVAVVMGLAAPGWLLMLCLALAAWLGCLATGVVWATKSGKA